MHTPLSDYGIEQTGNVFTHAHVYDERQLQFFEEAGIFFVLQFEMEIILCDRARADVPPRVGRPCRYKEQRPDSGRIRPSGYGQLVLAVRHIIELMARADFHRDLKALAVHGVCAEQVRKPHFCQVFFHIYHIPTIIRENVRKSKSGVKQSQFIAEKIIFYKFSIKILSEDTKIQDNFIQKICKFCYNTPADSCGIIIVR